MLKFRTRHMCRQQSARSIMRGILCHYMHGHSHVAILAFRHLPPNSARTGYYHWRELPHIPFLSRQNTSFVAKNNICRDNHNFVATSLHVFCRDKILVLSGQEYFSRDKRHVLSRQTRFCRYKNDTCGSSRR